MKVRLTDICTPRQWKTIPTSELLNEGYPVYGANGIIGYYNGYNHESPVVTITCRGATCGTINITAPKSYVTGNAMCLDDLRPDVLLEYLYYSLLHYNFRNVISGSAQPQITRQGLEKVNIELHSLDEQRTIIDVLSKLERIILARKEELQKLDNLVKARFVEMFGIYPSNQMGWETGKIRDTVADVRYGSSRPAVDGGKYPYLRMNNITYGGELDLSDVKRIDVPENELDKCTVRRGDVLFNRTNSKELVGKTCVYDRDEMMVLAGFVIRVRVNDRVLPEFLSAFLNTDFSKKTLSEMCKAAIGQANINAQEMQNIGLYLPPLELQRQFVQFKKQVDKSKVVESIHRMNVLFNITLNGGNRYDIRANEF